MHRGLSQHRTLDTNSASTVHLLSDAAAVVPMCQTMQGPGHPTATGHSNHFHTMCTSILPTLLRTFVPQSSQPAFQGNAR